MTQFLWLSRSLNLIWLSLISRGPKVEITGTTVPGPGNTHSANSCAVPYFAGKPRMYQQSSFPVSTLLSSKWPLGCQHLFAVMPQYGALVNNLIVTTDEFIMGYRDSAPSLRWSSRTAEQRITPTRLAWPVALRASRDITIQASIEYVVSLNYQLFYIVLSFSIGRIREYIDLADGPVLANLLPFRILG